MSLRPLIVGAGPTGLSAALFLARRGIKPRLIDAADHPSQTSKALGVNPRTLDLLQGTGVEAMIIAEGQAMHVLNVHANGRRLARLEVPYEAIGARHCMTILPQARTEALLTHALAELGVEVERGRELRGVSQDERGVVATVEDQAIRAPILLAADGAHSAVRHALKLGFPGESMPEDWKLMDVELEGPPPGEAWIDFRDTGPFVALPFDERVWRLIGFGPPLLERLPEGWKAGKVHWVSDFHVSHRVVEQMTVGRICLAGDAAHIHSPIGARGMNLGIEDAYVWAACADAYLQGDRTKLDAYGASRRKVDTAVVEKVKRLTQGARATGGPIALMRNLVIPLAGAFTPLRAAAVRQAIGLDHPVVIP